MSGDYNYNNGMEEVQHFELIKIAVVDDLNNQVDAAAKIYDSSVQSVHCERVGSEC